MSVDFAMPIGDRLAKLRKKAGLSQYALAEKAKVRQQVISRIEQGKTTNPTWRIVVALADALGCKLDAFRDPKPKKKKARKEDLEED